MGVNILVAHGGGPTAVINTSLQGVVEAARESGKVDKIYAARFGAEGILKGDLIDLTDVPASTIAKLAHTPASAIGSCRRKLTDADYPTVIETLKKFNIGCFFYNGGNDSMDTCHKIEQLSRQTGYELVTVGIPKTIDNDLGYTDHTPGYGSAARYIANNTRDLWMEVQAMPLYVTIMETMGRNAGWLTAAASLPHYKDKPCAQLIYLPERAFQKEKFLADVENLLRQQREILIVVSEGLAYSNGEMISSLDFVDGFGHKMAGGSAQTLCNMITKELRYPARAERLGFLGRASMVMQSSQDREEAIAVGRHALNIAMEGQSGVMVSIRRESNSPYTCSLTEVPLEKVANFEKKFPDHWINEGGNGVSEKFREYCLPLMGGDFPPYAQLRGRG